MIIISTKLYLDLGPDLIWIAKKKLNADLYKINEKFPIKTAMQGRTKYVFFDIVTEKSNFRLLSKAKVFTIEKSQSFTCLEFIFFAN